MHFRIRLKKRGEEAFDAVKSITRVVTRDGDAVGLRERTSDGEIVKISKEVIEARYDEVASVQRDLSILKETRSRFTQAEVAFFSFLLVVLITTGVLLYGGYLAIDRHVASGVITALCGAIPGTFSFGLYKLLSSANERSDNALKGLRSEVERKRLTQRTSHAAENVENPDSREALKILAALRAAMPDASPSDLASMLSAIRQPQGKAVEIHNHNG